MTHQTNTAQALLTTILTAAEARWPGQRILGEVPTEFFEGEWHFPKADGPEPWAVITYTDEPSPETGCVGWCWWALGAMGDAPTYEAACAAAVAGIQRRMDDRMAVL